MMRLCWARERGLPLPAPSPGVCNTTQVTIIKRWLIGLTPGIKNGCTAAVCHSPEGLNGVTCPVYPLPR
jgi:hypothetical protein